MWPHAASAAFTHSSTSGDWDDGSAYYPIAIRNLDGSLFRDPAGYAWIIYTASNHAMQIANGHDNDRPGLYKTRDFATFTRVTTAAPFLTWDSGTYSQNGTSWDGRVVQVYSAYWDGSQFIVFYMGDSFASGAQHYNFGIATCPGPSPNGAWTKYASNPTFSYVNIMYGGDVIHDRFESNVNKVWKQWFMDNQSNSQIAVKYCTAPSHLGPWTMQNSSNAVYVNSTVSSFYSGQITRMWQDHDGTFVMLFEIYDTTDSGSGHSGWTDLLVTSPDGITWTEGATVFTGPGANAWETQVVFCAFPVWDAEYGLWRLLYSGGNVQANTTDWELGLSVGCSSYASPASPDQGAGRYAVSPSQFCP